jgi:probable rRNA maturation factor
MFGLQNRLLEEWYESLRHAERAAALAERDSRLLGKTGFIDRADQA